MKISNNKTQQSRNKKKSVLLITLVKILIVSICILLVGDRKNMGFASGSLKGQGKKVAEDSKRKSLEPGREILQAVSLKKAAEEMELREKRIKEKENVLKLLQGEIDNRLKELTEVRNTLDKLLKEKKDKDGERFNHIIKIYESMKQEQAASVIDKLDEKLAIDIFARMKDKDVGKILGFIDPQKAARITEALSKFK